MNSWCDVALNLYCTGDTTPFRNLYEICKSDLIYDLQT